MLENRYRTLDSEQSGASTAKNLKKGIQSQNHGKSAVQISYIDSKKKSLDPQILTTYESFKKDFNFFISPRVSSDNVLQPKSKEIQSVADQMKKAKALAGGSNYLQQPKLSQVLVENGRVDSKRRAGADVEQEDTLSVECKNYLEKSKTLKAQLNKNTENAEKQVRKDNSKKEAKPASSQSINSDKKSSSRTTAFVNSSHLTVKATTKKVASKTNKSIRLNTGPSNCSLNSASNSSQHSFIKRENFPSPKENNFISVLEEPVYKKSEDSTLANGRSRLSFEPFKEIKNILDNKSSYVSTGGDASLNNEDRKLLLKNDTYRKIKEKIQNATGNNFLFAKERDRLSSEHGNRENEEPNTGKSYSNVSTVRSHPDEPNKTLTSIISSNLQKKINEFYSSSTRNASQVAFKNEGFAKASQKENSSDHRLSNGDSNTRKTSLDLKSADLQSRAEKYINALNNKNLKINAALHINQLIDPKESLDDLRERYRILKSGESVLKESTETPSAGISSGMVCTSKFSTAASNMNPQSEKGYQNKSIGGSSPNLLNCHNVHSPSYNSVVSPSTSSFNTLSFIEKAGSVKNNEEKMRGINEAKHYLGKARAVEKRDLKLEGKSHEQSNNFKPQSKSQPMSTKNVNKKHIDFDLALHKRQYSRDFDHNYNNYQISTNLSAVPIANKIFALSHHSVDEYEPIKSNRGANGKLDSHRTVSSPEQEEIDQETLSHILNRTRLTLESYKLKECQWKEEKSSMSNRILHLTERLSVYEEV